MQDAVISSADDIMADEGLILLLDGPSNGPDLACKEAHAGNRGMYLAYVPWGSHALVTHMHIDIMHALAM